ncbi:MAG: hypothetical protein GY756_23860 [bacterium]|nr:hypothetical protein [bacterium]
MKDYNLQDVTTNIKAMLSNFRLLGIASNKRFNYTGMHCLADKHPWRILEHFQSVIVFGDGKHKKDDNKSNQKPFSFHVDILVSPMKVIKYLDNLGYQSEIIHKSSLTVSLVDMAVKAGIGELSPVNSLVSKGYGLTPSLQAIITEAPLIQDELPKPKTHCIQCNLCLKVCPIRDEAYAPGDMRYCACNKCVEKCPV